MTRVRTADDNKDLEIAEWKCYGSVCSNNDKSFLVSKYFPAVEQGKPAFFDVAVADCGEEGQGRRGRVRTHTLRDNEFWE